MLFSYRSTLAGLFALATLCWTQGRASAADLKYLPGDTEVVITLNLRQILDSVLVKTQKETFGKVKELADNTPFKDNEEAQRYLKATGFDLFRDLHSITLAHPGGHDHNAFFLIVEGNFDRDKFYAVATDAAKEHGDVLTIGQSGKHKIIEIAPPNNGKTAYIVMLDGKTVLVAQTKDRITAALARADGTKKSQLKKEIRALLKTTNSTQSLSGVATGTALSRLMEKAPVPNAGQATEMLKTIEGLSGAVTVGKDIQFQLGISTKDEATAANMAQQANLGLVLVKGMVAQQAKQDAKLLPAVDIANTLSVAAQGSSLLLRGHISVENLGKLLKNLPNKNQ